ncbi:TetR/AcrR family transcriptional regulator [Fredinandcohnia quinoae]|uniref:TetR family transcriptional regulator n=1 Tax=Fredinandcohnia quinoae TaxID=2918902 RepID=A0AAW5DVC3_9BACI|nr:TetR/AcrR family transcriptional regulator [Fredinandcohnia sp. SECRCQ15]MCH1624585.1 TetR family transcriptional regulator [Fredinandcohnia sp. SECRCQ15]
MPKLTFFNLPEEKKQTLIQAAEKEFSRVPLFEASITNIIKEAGIPRGSFYQYFEDKDDAFFFLVNEFARKMNISFVDILRRNDGDIFDTMVEVFQLVIGEEENLNFLRNAFLNMTYKIEHAFGRIIDVNEISENFRAISPLIKKSNLNISNDKELFHVLQIIKTITFRHLIETFAQELSTEEAIENYMIEVRLLKHGLARK